MMKERQIVKYRMCKSRGFTLIEVIAVLVILAIVSALVISRGMATDDIKLQVAVDTLKGHLRFAQSLAMNNTTTNVSYPTKWGIQINGQDYTLVRNSNGDGTTFDSPSNLPNESSATHRFAGTITATVVNVLFDECGSPYNVNTKITSEVKITLTPGSNLIRITPETGFIP